MDMVVESYRAARSIKAQPGVSCHHNHHQSPSKNILTINMTISNEENLVRSNRKYAKSFDDGDLSHIPAKRYAIGQSALDSSTDQDI